MSNLALQAFKFDVMMFKDECLVKYNVDLLNERDKSMFRNNCEISFKLA